jgi:hypothetical protein
VQGYCIIPRNWEGTNEEQGETSFHKEISLTLLGHRHGMDKRALGCSTSSKWVN